MDIKKLLLTSVLLVFAIQVSLAKEPTIKDPNRGGQNQMNDQVSYRSDCAVARAQTDMAINNVRARLTTGGDVWRNGNEGHYIVPKPIIGSGVLGVSSIFAGAVWLGGYDPFDNLKVAAQTYRSQTANDFWPGPLNEEGQTDKQECARWDKFFKVLGENITIHLREFQLAESMSQPHDEELIPNDVLGWPGFGNPHFERIHGFPLPNTTQGLAGYYDYDGDGIYDPVNGDYPIIEIRGCPDPQYPDEMIFWIYNDAGNIHTQSRGFPIQMEVQVQAFAYKTNDEINDMTFQRYKLINRATDIIERTYFAMWVDPDLGCYQDDYVGCDSTRSLMYVYNEDEIDGLSGCDCAGTPTYCTNVPILGVDYFRGPLDPDVLDEEGNPTEIGMSSFIYYNNGSINSPPPATADPSQAIEYYRYLSGFWRDGTPFTIGGTGYNVGSTQTVKYAFPDAPNSTSASAWSMCSSALSFGDRRTVQASGPFRLDPGAVNELIIGVVWLPTQRYPCPSIAPLQAVDDIAQALFDNCFEITDGPDAPDMCFVELDREVIALLTNDAFSNNFLEAYEGKDLQAPAGIEDSLYRFEGYKVYQLRAADVGPAELNNPDRARLIYQADKRNGVSTLYNWKQIENPLPSGANIFFPEIQVEGADAGITHSFRITEDQFATTDKNLINHKKYYFTAVAYAYNDYEYEIADTVKVGFDNATGVGQRRTYLEGRNNVITYTVIPRPIVAEYTNAKYGDGVEITRLDGKGNYGAFLEVADGVYESILDGTFTGELPYKKGGGPINVKVVNPLEVKDAELELRMFNADGGTTVNDNTRWFVNDIAGNREIYSDVSMASLNEQILQDYGISITLGPVDILGSRGSDLSANENNGAVGASIEYADPNKPFWFSGVPDNDGVAIPVFDPNTNTFRQVRPLNYIKNASDEPDFLLDPTQRLQRIGEGIFAPMFVMDYRFNVLDFLVSPMIINVTFGPTLRARINPALTPNVDIILTSDKSKWSRCVVIQTSSPHYYGSQAGISTTDGTESFDYRDAPSVNRNGVYATSDGTFNGTPLTTSSENPDDPNYISPLGMGWFPGYAIDVECGTRVNIFFGENSSFDESYQSFYNNEKTITNDMIWNPSSQLTIPELSDVPALLFFLGGQHHTYVTKQPYDGCAFIHARLDPTRQPIAKRDAFNEFAWAGIPMLIPGTELLPLDQGLIPNDAIIKLRVNSRYRNECASSYNGGLPAYRIKISGLQPRALDVVGIENAMDAINVVPNPYYGYSSYEISQFTNTVKITNLPDKCTVTIYTMDGKFIKQYNRNESPMLKSGSNPGTRSKQTVPDLEWDMRNNKNIPIASGVYLIHVNAGDLGERVIKWFGVNRQFDPSGL